MVAWDDKTYTGSFHGHRITVLRVICDTLDVSTLVAHSHWLNDTTPKCLSTFWLDRHAHYRIPVIVCSRWVRWVALVRLTSVAISFQLRCTTSIEWCAVAWYCCVFYSLPLSHCNHWVKCVSLTWDHIDRNFFSNDAFDLCDDLQQSPGESLLSMNLVFDCRMNYH